MKFMNFKKNDIFEEKPTKPFSTGSASKINFEFNIIFDTQKLKFRKKKKSLKIKKIIVLMNKLKIH